MFVIFSNLLIISKKNLSRFFLAGFFLCFSVRVNGFLFLLFYRVKHYRVKPLFYNPIFPCQIAILISCLLVFGSDDLCVPYLFSCYAISLYAHTRTRTHTHARTHTHTHTHTHARTHTHTHTRMHVCTYARMHIRESTLPMASRFLLPVLGCLGWLLNCQNWLFSFILLHVVSFAVKLPTNRVKIVLMR